MIGCFPAAKVYPIKRGLGGGERAGSRKVGVGDIRKGNQSVLCAEKYSHPKPHLIFGFLGWRAARGELYVRNFADGAVTHGPRWGKEFRPLASPCSSRVDRPFGKVSRAFADNARPGRGSRVAHVRARGGIGDRHRSEAGARDRRPGVFPKRTTSRPAGFGRIGELLRRDGRRRRWRDAAPS